MRFLPSCLSFIAAALIFVCCQHRPSGPDKGYDTLRLAIRLSPAFAEPAAIDLAVTDSAATLQLLLKNYIGVEAPSDTFYHKRLVLSPAQLAQLDTSLIQLCRQRLGMHDHPTWVDGIMVRSCLMQHGDTNAISFLCADRETDSVGYRYSDSLFVKLRRVFHDSFADDYFDDLIDYIDTSRLHEASLKRLIDRLRAEKYHWTQAEPVILDKKRHH